MKTAYYFLGVVSIMCGLLTWTMLILATQAHEPAGLLACFIVLAVCFFSLNEYATFKFHSLEVKHEILN